MEITRIPHASRQTVCAALRGAPLLLLHVNVVVSEGAGLLNWKIDQIWLWVQGECVEIAPHQDITLGLRRRAVQIIEVAAGEEVCEDALVVVDEVDGVPDCHNLCAPCQTYGGSHDLVGENKLKAIAMLACGSVDGPWNAERDGNWVLQL